MAARIYSQEGAKMNLFEAARHQSRSLTPPKGRRARITCEQCQRRKVRCDAEISLLPCTNCTLDGVECMLFKGKRESNSRLNLALQIIEHTLRANPEPSPLSSSLHAQLRGFRTISSTHARRSALRRRTRIVSKEPMGADNSAEEYEEKQIPPQTVDAEPTTTCGCLSLPPFIRPPPKHLDDSDYEYLSRKNAFLVPGEALQRALVKSYFESVHAILPVIDMQELLLSMHLKRARCVSLFLYQAVMYSGACTVPFEFLADEGFSSRAEARDKFYSKVEALDRVRYETEPIDLIQGELLMAYWQGALKSPIHRSCWIQLALSNFQSLEPSLYIPLSDDASAEISKRKSARYRRIYWGCFLVDRLLALATRRRYYFSRSLAPKLDFLTPNDFYITRLPDEVIDSLSMCSIGASARQQMHLVKLFILNVSLFERLEEVMPDSHPHAAISTRQPSAEQITSELEDARRCTSRLLDWYEMFSRFVSSGESSKLIDVSQTFISIIFDASLSNLLYREFVHNCRVVNGPAELGDLHRKRLLATMGVTSAFSSLKLNGLLEYVPPCLTALLLSAAVTHWTQMRESLNPYLRCKNSGCFSQCLGILEALSDIYPSVRQWVNRLGDVASGDHRNQLHTEDDILFSLYPAQSDGTVVRDTDPLLAIGDDQGMQSPTAEPPGVGLRAVRREDVVSMSAQGKDYDEVAVPDDFAWFTKCEASMVPSSSDLIGSSVDRDDGRNISAEYGAPFDHIYEARDLNQKQGHSSAAAEPSTLMVNTGQFIDSPSGTTEQCVAPSSIFSLGPLL